MNNNNNYRNLSHAVIKKQYKGLLYWCYYGKLTSLFIALSLFACIMGT